MDVAFPGSAEHYSTMLEQEVEYDAELLGAKTAMQ